MKLHPTLEIAPPDDASFGVGSKRDLGAPGLGHDAVTSCTITTLEIGR